MQHKFGVVPALFSKLVIYNGLKMDLNMFKQL